MNFLSYRKKLAMFLVVCFMVALISYVQTVFIVPRQVTMFEGEEYVYDFKSPFLVTIKADRNDVIKVNNQDIKTGRNYFKLSSPILFRTQKDGSVSLRMSIFGIIPLRIMKVDVFPRKMIAACGNTVGVKLKIDGVLVIGVSDVETSDGRKAFPARDGGIRSGDIILEINGTTINTINDIIKEIEKSNGEKVKIKYKRGDNYSFAEINPVKSIDDKEYHIGLWVRESTAGIGTLTFYDPESQGFGALGHGITDIDTGTLMPVRTGEILESRILAIKKGKPGVPGELKGVIEESGELGVIMVNREHGIYGKLNPEMYAKLCSKLYPIGLRNQIKEGPAVILANIEGKKVEEYSIEILKVARQNYNGSKGMIIKITDKRLLETTGGIVQGMSGSPIIQNNRIIGAVTHVLVNDPTRGYAIFIENMLKNMERYSREAA